MEHKAAQQIPTLHVTDIELPREFERLYDLAFNLWWVWTPAARDLFAMIDTAKWALYRNPVQLLINVAPRHWYPLLEDETFLARYHSVIEDFDQYMYHRDTCWFRQHHGDDLGGPIAYFSMEYGLHHSLAVYSGGLGVLSGDHCKSASDLGIPFVAVGLLYRHGYFQQTIDADGVQQHIYPEYDFTRLPLRPVATVTGREVTISVPLPGREVRAKLWLAQIGRVPLILLDTDLPENDPADRPITNILYVRGREMRLVQEILLGMGGVKALRALGVAPSVWHLNEGHSSFLQLERWRELMQDHGLDLEQARTRLARNVVFTTHTPVPAGNEQFSPELVTKYLRGWCHEVGLPVDDLLRLGQAAPENPSFNLTALAIRTTSWVNGVSQLNAEVASRMWQHLLPPSRPPDPPIHAITNGVHTLSWIGRELRLLLDRWLGPEWDSMLLASDGWDRIYDLPDRELWAAHLAQKERLARFTRSRLREQFARHGCSPDELRAVGGLFDPNALTIGFARRFAIYKRAGLIFSDLRRLRDLLSDDDRPLQIIVAGKAHPADRPAQNLIQHIFELSRSESLAGRVFFLENHNMRMGRMLVQGVDIWLNTPRRPLEASGTSGQKAALNGALNFSILDGWWPEGYNGRNGWVIGTDRPGDDEEKQDWDDAQSLYKTLESMIIPLYYERDEDDLPRRWIGMMKEAIATLTPRFSANRMVRDYVERGYLPAAARERGEPIPSSG